MNKEEKPVCVDCRRVLKPEDEQRTWGKCSHCQKPVCFECSHYRAVFKKSLYIGSYVEAL